LPFIGFEAVFNGPFPNARHAYNYTVMLSKPVSPSKNFSTAKLIIIVPD